MKEEKKIDLEEMALEIITNVGTARSMYVEAVEAAKTGNFEEAHNLVAEGEKIFVNGHHAHADLVNAKIGVEELQYMFLVMHAEDQLMSAETLKIVCDELIDMLEAKAKQAN
ncbi:MAG TPA: PTS lactose/cellobiose transporter subunit IIA [Candidatus Faecalibacterium faecigallinarum]|mgnify:FL=1|uniref:PTS lactose/cellobiose transporter subunit IIA n=1 Tax=Candidatus Faecalibacterium faecigallinarum TaxID=2838577 RepID=A0A9D2P7M8_9FIRM|nr:PTS lactose/cellobiose transporter subunit IIA [Candidatus Faecalibacterium faecigallinarum]